MQNWKLLILLPCPCFCFLYCMTINLLQQYHYYILISPVYLQYQIFQVKCSLESELKINS